MNVNALIADDHPLFRNAMQQALSKTITGQLFEADNYTDACRLLAQEANIDIVFFDLNMPGNEGLFGLTQLVALYPNHTFIVVSAHEEHDIIARVIALGAAAYIPKSTSLANMVAAVERVIDGEVWLPFTLNETSSEPVNTDFHSKLATLTPHQLVVLEKVAGGLLNKQIAYELDISESTVKQHVSAGLRKLGVYNRTQAGVIFKQVMQIDEEKL